MIVPFVSVRDAAAYKAFLSKAFGAEETHPDSKDPSGKVRQGARRHFPFSDGGYPLALLA